MNTSLLAAVAACVAALLSGTSLLITPGRERQKWIRETALDGYTNFFEASFSGGAASQIGRDLLRAGRDVTLVHGQVQISHETRNEMRSRLRLIAPPNVVVAMSILHKADDLVADLAFQQPPCDDAIWRTSKDARKAARGKFVNAVRASMRLPEGGSISL